MTVQSGMSLASSYGGVLTNVESAAQNTWILQNVVQAGGNTVRAYIGLSDDVTEGLLGWMNGDRLGFANWASGEPSNVQTRDFTVMNATSGAWSMAEGTALLPVVFRVSGPIRVPTEYPTIQQAISAAIDGQTIEVLPGVYTEKLDYQGKRLMIRSVEGASITTIVNPSQGPGVIINPVNSVGAGLHGFTVTQSGSNPFVLIYVQGRATISGCRISNPTGFAVQMIDEAVLSDSLIVGSGVAVLSEAGAQASRNTVQNCTIAGNNRGIAVQTVGPPATLTLLNSVTIANVAPFAAGAGANILFLSNVIAEGPVGGPNLNASAQFANAPGGNGVYDVTDDYRLLPGSPGIDAGNNGLRKIIPAVAQAFDVGGMPRYIDAPDVVNTGAGPGPICDTGAHEFEPVPQTFCPGDFNRDGFIDFFDFDEFIVAFEVGC